VRTAFAAVSRPSVALVTSCETLVVVVSLLRVGVRPRSGVGIIVALLGKLLIKFATCQTKIV